MSGGLVITVYPSVQEGGLQSGAAALWQGALEDGREPLWRSPAETPAEAAETEAYAKPVQTQ